MKEIKIFKLHMKLNMKYIYIYEYLYIIIKSRNHV